jgi:hypothetical protein
MGKKEGVGWYLSVPCLCAEVTGGNQWEEGPVTGWWPWCALTRLVHGHVASACPCD